MRRFRWRNAASPSCSLSKGRHVHRGNLAVSGEVDGRSQASLSETLTGMAAKIVSEAAVTLQALGKPISEDSILCDSEMSAKLRFGLEALFIFVSSGLKRTL
jgi:hypothetical protein